MDRLRVQPLTEAQIAELEELFQKADKPINCTRAQTVLLSAEKGLSLREMGRVVGESHENVRRWLKRYMAEGIDGLLIRRSGSGRKPTVTDEYRIHLLETVQITPSSLGLEYPLWSYRRLADYMAEETGIRVSYETVRRVLAKEGITLSRP